MAANGGYSLVPLVEGSNAFQSVLEFFTAAVFHSSEVKCN